MNFQNRNERPVSSRPRQAAVNRAATGGNDGANPVRTNPRPADTDRLIRLPEVLQRLPISRSSWWAGVKNGRFPRPVKLGPRTTTWRLSDITALVERLSSQGGDQ
jgi:predicted DNA-binding transcriptional regulator AlpA